jgi:N-acetylneuraminic acid mutarotase
LYSLDEEKWIECKADGQLPKPVFGHGSVLCGEQLIIIGGNIPNFDERDNSIHPD